jgi:excinuclease ABC subunit B
MVGQILYVSATPGPYEESHSVQVAEQIIRPTGLVDPQVEVRKSEGQIDDLLREIRLRTDAGDRTLITTLTKKMAEDLTDYLRETGVKVRYLHSDIDTLERVEIIRDLRLGVFDVLVGINLLREGLDLPEVSLIAILDADKEGYLRGYRSLIQTIGRAARNINGQVIMYADRESDAMRQALGVTERRRTRQTAYNEAHGITPQTIVKAVHNLETHREEQTQRAVAFQEAAGLPPDEVLRLAKNVEREMKRAARDLEFERAAELRDQLTALRRHMDGEPPEPAGAGGRNGSRGRPRGRRRQGP